MASRTTAVSPATVARRTLVASVVVLGLAVLAVAIWKVRLVVALVFGAIVIASAMRPGVDALHSRGVPRGVAVALHYAVVGALAALVIWFAAPRALSQVQHATDTLPETRAQVREAARSSGGLEREFLLGLERRLERVPTTTELVEPAVELTRTAIEVIVGIFFLFASAAYWIFERDRVQRLVASAVPKSHREDVRETWNLVELKLGAFVRGQLLLVVLVSALLSLAFWAIGLPYWLLVGLFAGLVELVPVLGPLLAGALAIGVGLTESWQVALLAGIAVLAVRLLEDYLVAPRVLGRAVGLSPLVVLTAVSAAGVVFGGLAVLLAVPAAALVATLIDVLVLDKDPAAEEVPAVVFPAKESD